MTRAIRVATATNYNFTRAENAQLWETMAAYPEDRFFVNTQGETVPEVVPEGLPVVLTLNPYLDRFVEPDERIAEQTKWVRIKAVHDPKPEVLASLSAAFEWAFARDLPIVWTVMRFFSRASLERYSEDPESYDRNGSEYFPPAALGEVLEGICDDFELPFYVCDPTGAGCEGCGLCSILTFDGLDLPIYGLNLSSSLPKEGGHCDKDCPDCWAKRVLARARHLTGGRPKVDVIFRNGKQKKGRER